MPSSNNLKPGRVERKFNRALKLLEECVSSGGSRFLLVYASSKHNYEQQMYGDKEYIDAVEANVNYNTGHY